MAGLDALKRKAASGDSQKKSKTPVIELPADLIVKAVSLHNAYRELKTAESSFEVAEGDIMPDMLRLHSAQCQRDGELYPSVKFHSKGDEKRPEVSGTFTVQRRLCKIAPDQEETLATEFDAAYKTLFNSETTVKVDLKKLPADVAKQIVELLLPKLAALEVNFTDLDNATAERLLALDGDHKAVDVATEIKPTEQFFQKAMFDSGVSASVEKMKKNGVIKPFKPSFKL